MGGVVGQSVIGSITWCAACWFGGLDVLVSRLVDWLVVLVSRSLGRGIVWTIVRLMSWWMVVRVLRWVELSVRQLGSRLFGWLVGG
jgi:hypothetical protein